MFLYPLFPAFLHLSADAFGLWSGSSIHEIAQVSPRRSRMDRRRTRDSYRGEIDTRHDTRPTGDFTRVPRRPPFQPAPTARRHRRCCVRVRLYCALSVNGMVSIPASAKAAIVPFTNLLLPMARAAMGLETEFRKLKVKGLNPFGLAAESWISSQNSVSSW